jgi:hypothetical protein
MFIFDLLKQCRKIQGYEEWEGPSVNIIADGGGVCILGSPYGHETYIETEVCAIVKTKVDGLKALDKLSMQAQFQYARYCVVTAVNHLARSVPGRLLVKGFQLMETALRGDDGLLWRLADWDHPSELSGDDRARIELGSTLSMGLGGLSLPDHTVVSSYAYIAGLADVCVTNCAKVVNLRDSLLTNPDTQLAKDLEEHTAKTWAFFDSQTSVPVCIPPTAATLLRDLEFYQEGSQGKSRKKMQCRLGAEVNKIRFRAFIAAFDDVDLQATARGHAVDSAHVWLTALPGGDSALTMTNRHFTQAVQKWLGFPELRVEQTVHAQPQPLCICGKTFDRAHLTECGQGGHPTLRHNAIQLSMCNACADHDLHVTCEAPMQDGQQGGEGGGRLDLIARNARGREIGVDLTITNHLNDGLRNYRHSESYGGMANIEAEFRKNRLPYAAECKKRGIIYFGASMATDGTFGPGLKRFLIWITKNLDKESQRFFPSSPSSIRQDREADETNFTIPTRVKYYLVKLSVQLQCLLVDQADAVAEANWAHWTGKNVETNDMHARDNGRPHGFRFGSPPGEAAPTAPAAATTAPATPHQAEPTRTPVMPVGGEGDSRPTAARQPSTTLTPAHDRDSTINTNTHTHNTTHTMDTALHTHTGVVPALSTMGRPETAEGGETAEDGQLETNGQNDMMVEGGPGGGITSQHHAEDGRRSVLPVIACSPRDATDVVVGRRPAAAKGSNSATPLTSAECNGAAAETSGAN